MSWHLRHLVVPLAFFLHPASVLRLSGQRDGCNAFTLRPGRAKVPEVIVPLVGELNHCFDRCALVGSSADMIGKQQGKEIDDHDTVIRVNRLPTPDWYEDFGSKTDVYFTEPGMRMLKSKTYMTTFLGVGTNYNSSDTACNLESGFMEGNVTFLQGHEGEEVLCPFASIVFKGTDVEKYNLSWSGRFPEEAPGFNLTKAAMPLAHQSGGINGAAPFFPGMEKKEPTSGFQALLTFAPICSTLDTYGFSGEKTSDHHEVSPKHDLDEEHAWESRLVGGDTPSPLQATPGTAVRTFAFNWLVDEFADIGKHGSVTIVRV